jgi:chemotaxis protein CheZ
MDRIEEKRSPNIAALLRASDRETLFEVMRQSQVSAETLRPVFNAIDAAIYRELKGIADYISFLRTEIGQLQVNELRSKRIPAAGEELSAVVSATEAAGNAIMTRAEAVMSAEATDLKDYKAFVDEQMLAIFEACSFQDLTGQRITKVVRTLEQIETRVSRFAVATNANDRGGFASEAEAKHAERQERLMLNGPALAGEGVVQTEIDAMLDSPKIAPDAPKAQPAPAAAAEPSEPASQGDIDKLFS